MAYWKVWATLIFFKVTIRAPQDTMGLQQRFIRSPAGCQQAASKVDADKVGSAVRYYTGLNNYLH